jgi:hypothetical protein
MDCLISTRNCTSIVKVMSKFYVMVVYRIEKYFKESQRKIKLVDPFLNCVTLPSARHLIYRRNFMKPQKIALIPDHGFDPTQNFCHKQILWLKYISFEDRIQIQHCFNNLEKKVCPYPVDGYCKL